jgi:hypothetical protein
MSKNIDRSPYMYEIISNAINKSLKIPKGQTEIVYRRGIYITIAKRKKVQKDKQRSTKHTNITKDPVTRTRGGRRCSGKVSSSCLTSDTR